MGIEAVCQCRLDTVLFFGGHCEAAGFPKSVFGEDVQLLVQIAGPPTCGCDDDSVDLVDEVGGLRRIEEVLVVLVGVHAPAEFASWKICFVFNVAEVDSVKVFGCGRLELVRESPVVVVRRPAGVVEDENGKCKVTCQCAKQRERDDPFAGEDSEPVDRQGGEKVEERLKLEYAVGVDARREQDSAHEGEKPGVNAVVAGKKHPCQRQDPDERGPAGDFDEEDQAAGKRAEAIESGADFTVIQELLQYGIEVGEVREEDDDGREKACRNEITCVADGSVDFD